MDLRRELEQHFKDVKDILYEISDPAKKAAAAAATTAALKALIDLEAELNNTERNKYLERALVNTLNKFPEELKTAFFTELEKELEHASTLI